MRTKTFFMLTVAVVAVLLASTAYAGSQTPLGRTYVPIWVPTSHTTLDADCLNTIALPPVTYWAQNRESSYVLRALVQGRGVLMLDVAGQGHGSVPFDTGARWQPVSVAAPFAALSDMPLQLSISLAGPASCPASAHMQAPNLFAAP